MVDRGSMGPAPNRKRLLILVAALVLLFLFPTVLPRFYVYMAAIVLVYGLAATSLNLALGFGGLYQFHHAVFYGVGAYGAALLMMKTGLSPWLGFVVGPLVATLLGLVMGLICIRLSKLYFGMLQISLGSLVWAIVYRWYSFTGGDDGIHGVPVPDLISSSSNAYYFTLIVTLVSMYVMHRILKAPFGSVLQGIRDNPVRSEMIGVNVRRHQLMALVIASFFAGVAGSLFVAVDPLHGDGDHVPPRRLAYLHGTHARGCGNRGAAHLREHLYRILGPCPRHHHDARHILSARGCPRVADSALEGEGPDEGGRRGCAGRRIAGRQVDAGSRRPS